MSLHSLWHDLRLEMSLNSHFNHIHVITYKKQDIYISLTHKQFRGFKSETRRFFSDFFPLQNPTEIKLFYLKNKNKTTATFEEPANIYYESIIINANLNESCIHCSVLQDLRSSCCPSSVLSARGVLGRVGSSRRWNRLTESQSLAVYSW